MKRIFQIILGVAIIALVYVIYVQISTPLNFNKELATKKAAVIERIKDIRTAQRAFKTKYQHFTSTFDSLENFILNDTLEMERKLVDEDDSVGMAMLKKSGKKLSELAGLMKVYPQTILNVRADKEMKKMVKVDEGVAKRQQELEAQMNGNGRILVRPSGTEPVIRIMVEGPQEDVIARIAKEMEQVIVERLGYNEDCKGLETI